MWGTTSWHGMSVSFSLCLPVSPLFARVSLFGRVCLARTASIVFCFRGWPGKGGGTQAQVSHHKLAWRERDSVYPSLASHSSP